jgi:hypothetical protein
MQRPKSLLSSVLVLILVPAAVALGVTLFVLSRWDRQQEPDYVMLPTHSGTALIPERTTQESGAAGGEAETASEGEPAGEEAGAEGAAEGCENPVHVIAAGETLSNLSEQYDIAMDDIIAMNEMLDPQFNANFLSIGQEVVIPACGVPTPTPSATPTETQVPTRNVPTPNPTGTEQPGGVVEVEIARVLNPGEVTTEAVEIINRGTSVARLGGWEFVNERNDASFEFPPLNLFPQGAVTVYTGVGEDTAIDIYWGQDEAVWEPGDTILLYDAEGELQDEFDIPER